MLPNNLRYMNKVESAPARQYTSTIQPQTGTSSYAPNNKIIINIPTNPNTVLVPSESYLKFNLDGLVAGVGAPTATNYIRLDKAGAHGIFQRCRVTHGSTLIEDIDNYGCLVGLMMALQQTTDSLGGKLNVMAGTTSSQFTTSGSEVTCQTVGERLGVGTAGVANSGANVYAQIASGANLAARTIAPRTYTVNLMSYIGSLSGSQYIPLFEMTSAPLTLELQLVSTYAKFMNVDVALAQEFILNNVEFVGTFIELSDDSINIIRSSQGGAPLQYVIQQYANVQGSAQLLTSATSVSLPVSAKYASLKSLFCVPRQYADGSPTFFPLGSQHFNLSQFRLRIGSQILPAKAPNTIPEYYAELVKAIGSLSDMNHEPSINWKNYNVATPSANAETGGTTMTASTKSDCFALGFDVETYSNSNKDKIFAGMNTLNSDIFWNLDFAAQAGVTNIKFDFYALYDQVIMFENGMTRVVK